MITLQQTSHESCLLWPKIRPCQSSLYTVLTCLMTLHYPDAVTAILMVSVCNSCVYRTTTIGHNNSLVMCSWKYKDIMISLVHKQGWMLSVFQKSSHSVDTAKTMSRSCHYLLMTYRNDSILMHCVLGHVYPRGIVQDGSVPACNVCQLYGAKNVWLMGICSIVLLFRHENE